MISLEIPAIKKYLCQLLSTCDINHVKQQVSDVIRCKNPSSHRDQINDNHQVPPHQSQLSGITLHSKMSPSAMDKLLH
jgi:hypothetical protein